MKRLGLNGSDAMPSSIKEITDLLNVVVAFCTFLAVLYGVRLAHRAFGMDKRPFVYLKDWTGQIYDDGLSVKGHIAEGRQVPTIVHSVVTEFNIMGHDLGTVTHSECAGVLICGEHSPAFIGRSGDTTAIKAYRDVREIPNLRSSIASIRIHVVLSVEGASRKERWRGFLRVFEERYDPQEQRHIFRVDGNLHKVPEGPDKRRLASWLRRIKRPRSG